MELAKARFNVILAVDLIEAENSLAVQPEVAFSWQAGKLDAVVGHDSVPPIRNRLD
jgi:hypothetical protein